MIYPFCPCLFFLCFYVFIFVNIQNYIYICAYKNCFAIKRIMDNMDKYIDKLKKDVEERMEKPLYGHRHFTELAERIFQHNKEIISPTTLKRLWGYLKQESPTPQKRTLSVLAQFIGFKGWDDYCDYQNSQDNYSSEFVKYQTQHCFLMKPGELVRISWYPERHVVLRHEGDGDLFTVLASENSKLEPGMTLHSETFTMKEALVLKNIKGESITEPCDYICGKIGGIEYEIIKEL